MMKKILMIVVIAVVFFYGCVNLEGKKEKTEVYNINLSECVGCSENEKTEYEDKIVDLVINQKQTNDTEENKTQSEQLKENQTQQNLENQSKVNETMTFEKQDDRLSEEENATIEQIKEEQNESEFDTICVGPTFENINLRERYSIKYKNTIYTDECVSWNTIKKYYCKDESVMSANFNCEPGEWCQNGACEEYEGSCIDSDSNDTTRYGSVSYAPSIFTNVIEHDRCVDEFIIEEWICDGSKPSKQTLECGSGFKCSEGKCVKSKCKEKDGGINPLVFSYTSNEEESANDACIDDYVLREYYCYGDDVRHIDIKCKDKCLDDSCMPIEE